ncbi:tRNA lysidine(34) synthetase TilS, partial [Acidobacteriota bacterium]
EESLLQTLSDEAFVRDMARDFSLPIEAGSGEVRTRAREEGWNLEETGRILRYDFLNKTALEIGADRIATAHTRNDQAETFLIRLLRGSGRQGLSGIYPLVEGKIIRPLLFAERREIETYLEEKRLSFRLDESNRDRRFLRNRIRLDLIPQLREDYEPQIVSLLAQSAHILQEEESLLQTLSDEAVNTCIIYDREGVALDMSLLRDLPRGLARRVVRSFILAERGDLRRVSFEDVESVLELAEGKRAHLKGDLKLVRDKNNIRFEGNPEPEIGYCVEWDAEDPLFVEESGLKFTAKKEEFAGTDLDFENSQRVFLDFETLQFPLTVRSRREGDRYHPIGAPGSKKIKEVFRAKGVAVPDRSRHPVVLTGDEIVWVLGLPVSEKYKVTDSTRTILVIDAARL